MLTYYRICHWSDTFLRRHELMYVVVYHNINALYVSFLCTSCATTMHALLALQKQLGSLQKVVLFHGKVIRDYTKPTITAIDRKRSTFMQLTTHFL
jgi:hypothetical protein